eukprot:364759-Chlamydomonas_euryale.AAC.23
MQQVLTLETTASKHDKDAGQFIQVYTLLQRKSHVQRSRNKGIAKTNSAVFVHACTSQAASRGCSCGCARPRQLAESIRLNTGLADCLSVHTHNSGQVAKNVYVTSSSSALAPPANLLCQHSRQKTQPG